MTDGDNYEVRANYEMIVSGFHLPRWIIGSQNAEAQFLAEIDGKLRFYRTMRITDFLTIKLMTRPHWTDRGSFTELVRGIEWWRVGPDGPFVFGFIQLRREKRGCA